jgi:hypothetical protein
MFDEWHPGVDGVIDDLRIKVNKLSTLKVEVGKISKNMEHSRVDDPSVTPSVFATAPATKSTSAPASPSSSLFDAKPVLSPNFKSTGCSDFQATPCPPTGFAATRPNGHRVKFGNREGEFGVVTTLIPPPGKDTFTCQPPSPHPLPSPPPRPPSSRHPQPHPGGHYDTGHQGVLGAAIPASFPSLIS